MNLASNLLDSASAHADRVVLRLGEATTTYRDLDGKILEREIVPPADLGER